MSGSSRPTTFTGRKRVLFPIRMKLVAALVLPLTAVAALCWVQVSQARDQVAEVEAETDLARTALAPGGLVDALIVEQGDATVTPLGLRETAQLTFETYEETVAATDTALTEFRAGLADGGPVAVALFEPTLERIEGQLAEQRQVYAEMMTEGPGLMHLVPVLDELYPAYSEMIDGLIEANDDLADSISNSEMRGAAHTLNGVNRVHFNMSRLMSSVGTGILRPGQEGRDPVVRYLDLYEATIDDLAAQTDGPWAPAVTDFAEAPEYQEILERGHAFLDTGEIDLEAFVSLAPAAGGEVAREGTAQAVAQSANRHLAEIIDTELDDARSSERNYTYLAIAVMLFATTVALLVARSIIRPMRKLTDHAEEMAAVTLPNAVQAVLDTPADQDVVIPHLEPLSVKARDEVQTVASAINHVQSSALDLAVEQATLRRNIADSFVSLGRRTQNLIGLQLELITNLEHDEADPAVLESLYRLDHLATRARRNAESLVVLGGTAAQQTGGTPVAMTDVVRAMLSEVEAYQRVAILAVDDAYLPGSAAADVIHLLAELVENGLSFSPPGTQVEVVGVRDDAGYAITVTDHGVGMTAERLEQANRRLSDNESFTVAPSRYLGHYVTGKLARRVGAEVSLSRGADGGVIATVFLPASAMVDEATARRALGPASDPEGDDGTERTVKVDGRPPALVGGRAGEAPRPTAVVDAATVAGAAAGSDVAAGSDQPAVDEPAAVDEVPAAALEDEPVETTEVGLRKRVPGAHAKASAQRSPLLRSAAKRSAEAAPLGAETSPQQAQNLASLLTDYTSGLERGQEELAEAAATRTEQPE